MPPTRIPSATYRLQLNKDFRFSDAIRILDYLNDLGISDVYVSPILGSRKGSGHGYDVTDPTRINPELGSDEDFANLQNELQKRGMGLIVDIVPNHMAASMENAWWMDVLENGPQSAYAAYFDIDWHPSARSLDGKILLPVLGRPFGEVLDSGELKLTFQEGKFYIQYFDSYLPLSPGSNYGILNRRIEQLKEKLGEDSPAFHEFSGILAAFLTLTNADRRSGETAADRRLRFEAARDRLSALVKSTPEVAGFVEENLRTLNGNEGDPASVGDLQRLLAEQHYKLAYWQNVNESINYRRFFTIADLVGVRVEDPVVFEATHAHLLRLISRGPFTGLRIDHVDGLRDPLAYLNRLQERLSPADQPGSSTAYLLVEKILAQHESLPADWPVCGTTGYDYLNHANSVFVNPEGGVSLRQIYAGFIGRDQNFGDVLYEKKKLVMNTLLGVEMRSLGRQLAELASQDRYARELSRGQLIEALIEVTASLSVYRTYIRNMEIPEHAQEYIGEALQEARRRAPHLNFACFSFLEQTLLLQNPTHVLPDQREARLAFVMRWQQFTGPIVAKGMEDTALYVYHPLVSLNEVGGAPEPRDVSSREEFLRFLEERNQSWPHTLNATTTHDTKRSEDVRARVNVLSEMPEAWQTHLQLWARLNSRHKEEVEGRPAPDRNEEYFLYQTLLGAWPLEGDSCEELVERLQAYMVKATREAMVHTRWTRPNQRHEEALRQFVARILSPAAEDFLNDFRPFQREIAYYGMVNGLAQILIKIASPGAPDFYQGSELWDLRLVDPDNRMPVEFERRVAMQERLAHDEEEAGAATLARNLLEHWPDGRVKLFLVQKSIRFRRENPTVFQAGECLPLEIEGEHRENVIGFMRRAGGTQVVVAVPRWLSQVGSPPQGPGYRKWHNTELRLPPEVSTRWRSLVTGHEVTAAHSKDGPSSPRTTLKVADLFEHFPVAFFRSSN
jgi:(1->4)-alpha-D-glucan 1-alpha-D-glucosylmutase